MHPGMASFNPNQAEAPSSVLEAAVLNMPPPPHTSVIRSVAKAHQRGPSLELGGYLDCAQMVAKPRSMCWLCWLSLPLSLSTRS